MLALEKGRLQALQPLTDHAKTDDRQRWLRLRVTGTHSELEQQLLKLPEVIEVHLREHDVLLHVQGEETQATELLKKLLEMGIRVTEFAAASPDLKTLYLNSVRGAS